MAAFAIQARRSSILESLTRAGVVEDDRFAGDGMWVMKLDGVGRRPQARRWYNQLIRAQWVLRVERAGHRDEIDRGLRPALGEASVPEREVAQHLDLPDTLLAHVVVLVDAAFPPCALSALGRLVQSGLHHRTAAHLGRRAVRRDINDH